MQDPGIIPPAAIGADSVLDWASAAPDGPPGLEFLLYGLQSPINMGMILRIAETYQFQVSIYDQFRVLDNPERLSTIKDFACGAVSRQGFHALADEAAVARVLRGRRLVATSIVPTTCALPDFTFHRGDFIALGNEYDGLPDAVFSRADTVLHVPMPAGFTPKPTAQRPIDPTRAAPVARDGQPNLNVAMTAGILCYAAYVSALARAHPAAPPTLGVDVGAQGGR
jgi:tRNA G18 (ribose-2'-O)-methylase SpoU